ncbi:MAG: SPFH domain-containing protein [Planctomycetota bacterium]
MPLRLEVLQYRDDFNRSVVQRLPEGEAADIKHGAQLIVHQNQEAVFFCDGRPLDRFGPGRHTLTTDNVPLITRLLTTPWQESPFQAQVCFIGKQLFTDQKWGTRQPIAFRDREFGMIRLRGYGSYSFRVVDSAVVISTLAGTQSQYSTEDASAFLREMIVTRLADLLGSAEISLLDMATHYDEIAAGARAKIAEDFRRYGLELVDFFIGGISAPDEVQRAIDARSSITAVGDLGTYVKFQAVRSMRELAARGGVLPTGFGVVMPGLIHQIAKGLTPPEGVDAEQEPTLPAEPLTFDDLATLPATRDPRSLVRAVAESAGYLVDSLGVDGHNVDGHNVDGHDDGGHDEEGDDDEGAESLTAPLRITLPVHPLRQQRVEVTFEAADEEGNRLVSFTSVCGPVSVADAAALTQRLLEYNAEMVHGAFAIVDRGSGPMIVVRANQLADTADPLEISRLLTAVAWQADRAEEKLTGGDAF